MRKFAGVLDIRRIVTVSMSLIITAMCVSGMQLPQNVSAAPSHVKSDKKGTVSQSVVNMKLTETSGIRVRNNRFIVTGSTDPSAVQQLETVVSKYPVVTMDRLFKTSESKLDLDHSRLSTSSGKKLKNLNTWVRIELGSDQAFAISQELKELGVIETAYPEPIASIAVGPNMAPDQRYRNAAPGGLDGIFALSTGIPGSKGENVKVADVEGGWNKNHEDISKLRTAQALGTECTDDYWVDHGTAVASIIAGDNNGYGVTGIVPNTTFVTSTICGKSVAEAIDTARQNTSAGDIMLLEVQITYIDDQGNAGEYVPIEYYQAEYDAISTATAAGIIVVEAASNGAANLDDPKFNGVFTTSRPNSGAIMVGAGWPSDEHVIAMDSYQHHYERSRIDFSAYGSRLDVQAWGYYVTSAGYGDAGGVTPDPLTRNSWYTKEFAGTSSASAIIAGVAASASSAFEAKNGRPATPAEIKDLLVRYGTAQDTTSPTLYDNDGSGVIIAGALPGKIGPQPDLRAVLNAIYDDTAAPTTPTGLIATVETNGNTVLQWNISTDNRAVAGYDLYRGNTMLTAVGTAQSPAGKITYADTTAVADSLYTYKVQARDVANNLSAFSPAVTLRTPVFADDFRSNNFTKWTSTVNTVLSGTGSTAAARTRSTSAAPRASYLTKTLPAAKTELFVRDAVKVTTSGSHDLRLFQVRNTAGATVAVVSRTSGGYLALYNGVTGVTTTSSTRLALNTTYRIQFRTKVQGTSSINEVWLNGTKITALTKTHNLGTSGIASIRVGETATTRTFDVLHDNITASSVYIP